ncbi:MAG: ABC transporter permease subunit [Bacteroidota bacterium]
MSGVWTVFRHEWASFARSGSLMLMVLIAGVVGVGAAVVEHRAWQAEQAERADLQAQEVEQWLALGSTHIHKAAHRGYFIVRDLPAGVILDRGVWDSGGSSVWLEAHRRNAPQLRAVDAAAVVARGAPRGVGPVLLWLVPLLLAVLLHGIVAGERESGSLAFAVSSGASPGAIVVGKTLAAILLAWAAVALPVAVGAGLAVGGGLSPAGAATWGGSLLAALGIVAALVVVVSSLAKRPLGALVALLLIWFTMAVLWPRLAPGLVEQAAPIPSSQTVRSEAEVAAEGLVTDSTREAVRTRLVASGVSDPNPSGVSAMAAEIDAAEAFGRIFAPLEAGMARQADLLDIASWASPLAAADRTADAAVGLGDRDQFAFEARAEAMRIGTQMALNEGWARIEAGDRGNAGLWRSVVDAAETTPAPGPAGGYAHWGLVLWTVLATGGLLWASRTVRTST